MIVSELDLLDVADIEIRYVPTGEFHARWKPPEGEAFNCAWSWPMPAPPTDEDLEKLRPYLVESALEAWRRMENPA